AVCGDRGRGDAANWCREQAPGLRVEHGSVLGLQLRGCAAARGEHRDAGGGGDDDDRRRADTRHDERAPTTWARSVLVGLPCRRRCERRIVAEDLLFQLLELGAGLDAELVDEMLPRVAVRG